MKYKQIIDAIDDGDYDAYTDTVDADLSISLFDYRVIRNPKTNECIFYNGIPEIKDSAEVKFHFREISIDDIKEYLEEEATDGFFSFIGSDKQTELNQLDNDNLTPTIQSITMYDGYFNVDE